MTQSITADFLLQHKKTSAIKSILTKFSVFAIYRNAEITTQRSCLHIDVMLRICTGLKFGVLGSQQADSFPIFKDRRTLMTRQTNISKTKKNQAHLRQLSQFVGGLFLLIRNNRWFVDLVRFITYVRTSTVSW